MISKMNRPGIERIAFLEDYVNRPCQLKDFLPEIAAKGYTSVALYAVMDNEEVFIEFSEEAMHFGLKTIAFTQYMKQQEVYLDDHPDQKMIYTHVNGDVNVADHDGLNINWGCPYNRSFLKRYQKSLEKICLAPNLIEIWINDEAFLGFSENQLGCYCTTCQKEWEEEFGCDIPKPPFTDRKRKVQFIGWRINRWNDVHAEIAETIRKASADNDELRVIFQSSPECCVSGNPRITSVDLPSMVQNLDGLMSDPYYTTQDELTSNFSPREVFLSECSRLMKGFCDEDKWSGICTQGFSHPTFSRPLDERDGYWAGIIPLAMGINAVTSYTYTLQRGTPMQDTYERSFELDRYFAQTQPIKFAGIINSSETQCFDIDTSGGPESWLNSRMFAASSIMRHNAIPYSFIPSIHLKYEYLKEFPVILLPGVTCLSTQARNELESYVGSGGILIACGETATKNEIGEKISDDFMRNMFAIESQVSLEDSGQFKGSSDHHVFTELLWPDETTAGYLGGKIMPALNLSYITKVNASESSEIVAQFDESSPLSGLPAITERSVGNGKTIYFSGIPQRTCVHPVYQTQILNYAGRVLSNFIYSLAENKLPVRTRNFGAGIPINKIRPLDRRNMPTAEFMPCVGDDLILVTFPSYFKQPTSFQLEITVPQGKKCCRIEELLAGQTIDDFRVSGDVLQIDVNLGFDDCIKVFAFYLK